MENSFECERCGFTTAYKCALLRHLENKTPCETLNSNISRADHIKKLTEKKNSVYQCSYCDKKFAAASSRSRHEKGCKNTTENLIKRIQDLEMALQQQQQATINNGTINNGCINITVNNYGNENKSYLTKEFLTKCLRKKNQGMLDLIRALHFHPDHQENHNIKATNIKLPYIQKLVNGRWEYFDKNEVADELIKDGFEILDEHQCDNEEDLKQQMSKHLYQEIEKWIDSVRDKEKDTFQPLLRDVYLVVLNNSYMIVSK